MKRVVYVETTIISYLAAWPSRDALVASHQALTRDWWATRRHRFAVVVSRAVIEEASVGDPDAVGRRLALLAELPVVETTERAVSLATDLQRRARMPERAAVDALHVALAAVHSSHFLLTWNCRHIASAVYRPRIESVCRAAGVEPPVICTPLELMDA